MKLELIEAGANAAYRVIRHNTYLGVVCRSADPFRWTHDRNTRGAQFVTPTEAARDLRQCVDFPNFGQ